MIKKFLHKAIRSHHPWRDVKFNELAEIYTSMSLRSFGFSLIGIFVPVYLYQKGISLQDIFLFIASILLLRIPVSFAAGKIIGRIGPKHTIAISTVIFIVFLLLLLSFETIGWPLILLSFVFTVANGLFFIAYATDFSKIQHKEHGGKELGWLYIFERAGSALGPLVGGIAASLVAPELTMVLAIIVLLVSLVPLFLTNEPVRLHQVIDYRGFSNKQHIRDYISFSAFQVQNVASNMIWPLLIAVMIFTEGTYAKLGFLIALSMLISMFAARMYGRFIDNKKGDVLLKYGVGMNFALQLSRAVTTTPGGAIAVSTLGEPISLSQKMAVTGGFYDAAGRVEGYRIVYLVWGEVWSAAAKATYCLALYFASFYYDPVSVMRVSLLFLPFVGLFMLVHNFPALKRV